NITHLQIDRNQTDGFYIQVGNSETDKVPEKYREIKSLKNATRYTTEQLDEREREFLRLEKRREEHEYKLFIDLRERISEHAQLLQSVASILAEIDVYQNFAVHAVNNDWIRPEITE
ncbi:MAG: DNA mismatch repair protein MutS, partial [Halobacteriaceae archaeon]